MLCLLSKFSLINDKSTIFDKGEEKEELNVIIKSDVHGSSEALKMAIEKISHPEVKTKISKGNYLQDTRRLSLTINL